MAGKNQLKIRILTALDSGGWMNASAISALARFRPKRGLYAYLRRLQRWGLVRRRRRIGDFITFSVTERGRERLRWLQKRRF